MARKELLLLLVVCIVRGDDSGPQLTVNISSLGVAQGEINPLVTNVRQFIGIPFAQPPIGTLRFKPPIALVNFSSTNIYNATSAVHQGQFSSLDCIQISLTNSSVIYGQEDCLYLDIFLPLHITNGSLLPVVIYIYGGGFQTSDSHDPSRIIALYQNIIYVCIRYRVNLFGFMASASLSASRSGSIQSSGLQGFEDQQMAMKWVRDNIQSFAGDPNRVTVQGHSAGGISICFHLVAPASQGLFQRAIIESGGCDVEHLTLGQAEVIGDDITSYFCNLSSNVISCLQSINASTLLQYAQSKDYFNLFSEKSIHLPIDGLVIPDSIVNLFQQKKFATNISLLTGTTKDEFGLFITVGFEPGWHLINVSQATLSQWVQQYSKGQSAYLNTTYNPYLTPNVPSMLVNYYGLTEALSTTVFQCPVRRTAAYLANNGSGSVYLYSFEYVPLSSPFAKVSQSVHGQELPFVFNTANSSALIQIIFPVNTFSENEQLLASTMTLLWVRFIINGDPNMPIVGEGTNALITNLTQLGGWPAYSTNATINSSSYLVIVNTAPKNDSVTLRLGTNGYHAPICAAWDQVVPNPTIVKRCTAGFTGINCSTVVINNITMTSINSTGSHDSFTIVQSIGIMTFLYPILCMIWSF